MAKAEKFSELIALIGKAEKELISNDISDAAQRVMMLRGLYYGTPWSKEFSEESKRSEFGAVVRIVGFTVFTGGYPPDPRPILKKQLIDDLQDSQDIRDGRLAIDIGHALIGLEARNNSITRTFTLPGFGGSGLECVTWLGDLGGGAGNLAWRRANTPENVSIVFSRGGSDYGASINLEGDLAGFIIGSNGEDLDAPQFENRGVKELFENYLPSKRYSELWRNRSKGFLLMMGGRFKQNTLVNRDEIISSIKAKILEFATAYIIQRYLSTDLKRSQKACRFLEGASDEVTRVFVSALERNIINPLSMIAGTNFPKPSSIGECNVEILKLDSYKEAIEDSIKMGRDAAKDFFKKF